jgi:hypothetical protein
MPDIIDATFTGISDLVSSNRTAAKTNLPINDPAVTNMVYRAMHPREIQIVFWVNGQFKYFSVDEISFNETEAMHKLHGTGKGEGFGLLGGEIDGTGKFSVTSFVGSDGKIDELRGLFRKGKDHRAVYFDIQMNYVDYDADQAADGVGQVSPAASTEGRYIPLIALRWAKVKDMGVSVPKGNGVQTTYSFDYLSYLELV